MPIVYLGIRSGFKPEANVRKALELLSNAAEIREISTIYRTSSPDNPGACSDYACVVSMETGATPWELKNVILKNIERELSREKVALPEQCSIIMMDILIYDQTVIHFGGINIPDPDLLRRAFLAVPLEELEPDLILPEWNRSIHDITEKLHDTTMYPLPEYTALIRSGF